MHAVDDRRLAVEGDVRLIGDIQVPILLKQT